MDRVHALLDQLKRRGIPQGDFLGLLHVLIGRHVVNQEGASVCHGLTWRELSAWLKKVRWPPEAAAELGLDATQLPPRDRQRYWYSAIVQAHVDSPEAIQAGERVAAMLAKLGYRVLPAASRPAVPNAGKAPE